MKYLNKRLIALAAMPVIVLTTVCTGGFSISSFANEGISVEAASGDTQSQDGDGDEEVVAKAEADAEDGEVAESEADAEDEAEKDAVEVEEVSKSNEDAKQEDVKAETVDVCFFIKGGLDASIPEEPAPHPSSDYSDAIRVNGASTNVGTIVASADRDELLSDGYTASNEVTSSLISYPTADQIRSVMPDFDENTMYVKWYVFKPSGTAAPNSDVNYHVDGVILSKKEVTEEEPPKKEPAEAQPEEPEEPKVVVTIKTNDVPNITYDGQWHRVGGFTITVGKENEPKSFIDYIFDALGNFLTTKVHAADGDGTTFTYNGETYWVSVDAAYIDVMTPGVYMVPFIYNGQVIDPADIVIRNADGAVVNTLFEVQAVYTSVNVQEKITIESGTTVKNDDGQPLTNNKVAVTSGSLLPGHTLKVTLIGCQCGPGECTNEISSYTIYDEKGNDVTYMYDVTTVNGKLVLVDGNSSASSASSDDLNTPDKKQANSTGSSSTKKTANADGTETVTNTPYDVTSEADLPDVKGARRGETSDSSGGDLAIVFMMLATVMFFAFSLKKNSSK